MKISFKLLSATLIGTFLIFTGCSEPDAEEAYNAGLPPSAKAAATQLESAFKDVPGAESKQHSAALAGAMRQKNYEDALKSLGALRSIEVQNINQVMAVENANRRLQADILQAMEAGDPKAKRAWERMKRAGRN
jgi:hypothetical protein